MGGSPLYARCEACGGEFDVSAWRDAGGPLEDLAAFAADHTVCDGRPLLLVPTPRGAGTLGSGFSPSDGDVRAVKARFGGVVGERSGEPGVEDTRATDSPRGHPDEGVNHA